MATFPPAIFETGALKRRYELPNLGRHQSAETEEMLEGMRLLTPWNASTADGAT